ncbi:ubiquinol-cytochrome c reductase complex assembly factor 5 isoform X1 [Myotis yumanensis]|uniref:ubiquinol-cytochrome c reductase complex assembly factor 5 isoform X1 n=1 Tax=Myotis yumanensis TaxID=159337 RepID=UPI0038D4B58D
MFSRAQVRRVLQWVPGKQRLGVYRFLPFFFVLGGTMEWIMIKVRVGKETFYDVYRRKASERQYQRRLEEASETKLQQSINSAHPEDSSVAIFGFVLMLLSPGPVSGHFTGWTAA